VIFETERLVVRPWTHDDADVIYDIHSREEVARWLGATPRVMESLDEAHAAVDRWASRAEPDPTRGVWAVVPRGSTRPLGSVLLVELPDANGTPTGDVEVGWHLHPDAWGSGYATEAARGALTHGFAAGLPEVFAVVRPDNERSLAVCRRLGMDHLARTDRYYGIDLELFRAAGRLIAVSCGRPAGSSVAGSPCPCSRPWRPRCRRSARRRDVGARRRPACRGPTMSTMRTTSRSGGRRFVAVRMMSGIANACSRGRFSTRMARSAATSRAQASATRALKSVGSSGGRSPSAPRAAPCCRR
jgi:RimJ/RimL family protein N-acetyltransferase